MSGLKQNNRHQNILLCDTCTDLLFVLQKGPTLKQDIPLLNSKRISKWIDSRFTLYLYKSHYEDGELYRHIRLLLRCGLVRRGHRYVKYKNRWGKLQLTNDGSKLVKQFRSVGALRI